MQISGGGTSEPEHGAKSRGRIHRGFNHAQRSRSSVRVDKRSSICREGTLMASDN